MVDSRTLEKHFSLLVGLHTWHAARHIQVGRVYSVQYRTFYPDLYSAYGEKIGHRVVFLYICNFGFFFTSLKWVQREQSGFISVSAKKIDPRKRRPWSRYTIPQGGGYSLLGYAIVVRTRAASALRGRRLVVVGAWLAQP